MKPMPPSRPPAESPLVLDDQGQPRSRLYGDVYFSTLDGLAESRAVFLQGCGLPEAWAGRRRFTVGELGFGTGLNILALLDLWRRTAPAGAWLDIFSIEAHPLAAEEAAAVLAAWPEVADLAELLVRRWPGRARGFHRLDLPEVRATLDLAVMEAGEALAGWTGTADAWFLDGFAPSANPQMWRQEVLDLVAARSAAGARAATFTVAGDVRRGLQAAGFEVAKRPGFGRKRQMLAARFSPPRPPRHAPPAAPQWSERRAIVIRAKGEFEAAHQLSQAAGVLAGTPGGISMRTLQTIEKINPDPSKTVIFALPVEFFEGIKSLSQFMKEKK